jgi:hypothetical protein
MAATDGVGDSLWARTGDASFHHSREAANRKHYQGWREESHGLACRQGAKEVDTLRKN